jgi:DNA-binding MarR family transcriptional regulator
MQAAWNDVSLPSREGPMTSTTIPAGCWNLDLATGMLALCPHSRTMFGLSSDSTAVLTESEWANRFHPDDLAPVRDALIAGLVHRTPYAVRFRTVHPSGTIQVVLGVGRPLEDGGHARFVGWNFDVASTGDMAADWISAHPEVFGTEHLFEVLQSGKRPREELQEEPSSEALLGRAETILRIRAARERLLGRAAIGEPAFDLLLHLYVRSGQKEASLTGLATAAEVPHSSAVRWVRYLADKGLVELKESKLDRRATCVELTPGGRAVMDEFLSVR